MSLHSQLIEEGGWTQMGTRSGKKSDREWGESKRAERVLANSGATREGFAEPRGWSLKWDGASLPEDGESPDEAAPGSDFDVQ
jgi:hypothetical protein